MKKQIYFIHAVFLLIFLPLSSNAQFSYKNIPSKFKSVAQEAVRPVVSKSAYDITGSLPRNFVKDGTVDYTKYIQRALDKYRTLKMPNFPLLINDNGLKLRSNTTLIFQKNSKLVLKASGRPRYEMLNIHEISNVKVYYPVLEGDKTRHLNATGQWGYGISIKGSTNVEIIEPVISRCWGDGVCISSINGKHAENITLIGGILDDNRRNGITIASGKKISIENLVIANTQGHNPMSGIDIEPDNAYGVLEDVKISNVITFNNAQNGIVISPGSLMGRGEKNIKISIKDHLDVNSNIGLALSLTRMKKMTGPKLGGTISIENSNWKNNGKFGLINYKNLGHNINIRIQNSNILKTTSSGISVIDKKKTDRMKVSISADSKIKYY